MPGRRIAEVFIRVRDDVSGLRAETKAGIARETRGLNATIPVAGDNDPLKRTLGKVKVDLAALAAKVTSARLDVDDKEAAAKLASLAVRLDSLGRRTESPRISVTGIARAEAELLALDVTMDKLGSKLGPGRGGITAGADAAVSALGNLAGAGSALINPITVAAAGLAAIMAGPLIAAVLPVAAGFAGLAVVALPALSQIFKAVSAGRKEIRKLPKDEQGAATALLGLKTSWGDMTKAIRPQVMKDFTTALGIVKKLMPALKPLIEAAAKAAGKFLSNLSSWLSSPSGKKFLHWLETEGPKDIQNFGNFMWTLAQVVGRVFSFLRNAGNTWWKNVGITIANVKDLYKNFKQWIWSDFVQKLITFFTKTLPTAFDLFKLTVRLIWDKMEIDALKAVNSITGTFGKLPGPLGAPFRTAHKAIGKELAAIEADAAKTAGRINADWGKLHGKKVALTFGLNLPAGVSFPSRHIKGHAAGTPGAAPGWAWTGERGPELVHFRGGETVLPHDVSRRVAGYAGGTGPEVRGIFPSGSYIDRATGALQSFTSALAASIRPLLHINRAALIGTGVGGMGDSGARTHSAAVAQAFARALLSSYGWGASQMSALIPLWNQESGWNAYAVNASSGAYGIPQSLGHGHPYNLGDYQNQIIWGLNYIRGRYGSPAAAWGHERAFNWYGNGFHGWVDKPTVIGVGERGRERVDITPAGQAGSHGHQDTKAILRALARIEQAVARQGQAFGDALNGASRSAAHRARHAVS